jgi:hypothetical protein
MANSLSDRNGRSRRKHDEDHREKSTPENKTRNQQGETLGSPAGA